jgi:hypothetical protein
MGIFGPQAESRRCAGAIVTFIPPLLPSTAVQAYDIPVLF